MSILSPTSCGFARIAAFRLFTDVKPPRKSGENLKLISRGKSKINLMNGRSYLLATMKILTLIKKKLLVFPIRF